MGFHRKDNSNKPQTTEDAPWHCGKCGFETKNTDVMSAHVEKCLAD